MAKAKQTYAAKDRIEHSVHGLGTIVEVNDHYTTIAFDEAGTRKFVTSMVKLAPSDTEAPARRVVRKKKTTATKAKTAKTTKTTKATKTTKKATKATKTKAKTKKED